jgi:opacity protein-like surface antigen
MKRSVALAISVLALTAVAEPLFAAESETAAPVERERAAPSARRAQPARTQQRAAPQRQVAQQTQTSQGNSFTGSQAGGFGGGNVGGGSFADPVTLCHEGFTPSFGGIPCTGVPYTYSADKKIQGSGGGFYSYSIPLGFAVIGLQGEIVAQRVNSSSTQSNTHNDLTYCSSSPSPCGRVTSETYTSNFNIGTNGSLLVKFGIPVNIPLMLGKGSPMVTKDGISRPYNTSQTVLIYGLIGPTWARIDGSYAYYGTNYCATSSCTFSPPTTASGALSWSQTKTGIGVGVGAEWGFMQGVNLRLEYRYTSFGSISQDVPLGVGLATGSTCGLVTGSVCASTAHIDISRLSFQSVRLGVGVGF